MRKYISFFLIFFLFAFFHVYQKVKITVLAYTVHNQNVRLSKLLEDKSSLDSLLSKEFNLVRVNAKAFAQDSSLKYPKGVITVALKSRDSGLKHRRVNLLAGVLGLIRQAEAQP